MKNYRRKNRHGVLKIILPILIFIAVCFYDSNTRIVSDEFLLSFSELPEEFDGFRIVQISDLHMKSFGDNNEELIEKVSEQRPDIIAITGDLIDGERDTDYVISLTEGLADIADVYYVTGNHEWASGWVHELIGILSDCGATVLQNKYVTLERGGEKIVLAGVDDPNGPYDMKTPEELVNEIRENEGNSFTVMLCHRNDRIELWGELEIPLVLCGHAHGGIVRLPFTDGLISPSRELFPTYTSGAYENGDTTMLVSRGLGNTSNIPRLFNNPQLVTAVLKKG